MHWLCVFVCCVLASVQHPFSSVVPWFVRFRCIKWALRELCCSRWQRLLIFFSLAPFMTGKFQVATHMRFTRVIPGYKFSMRECLRCHKYTFYDGTSIFNSFSHFTQANTHPLTLHITSGCVLRGNDFMIAVLP